MNTSHYHWLHHYMMKLKHNWIMKIIWNIPSWFWHQKILQTVLREELFPLLNVSLHISNSCWLIILKLWSFRLPLFWFFGFFQRRHETKRFSKLSLNSVLFWSFSAKTLIFFGIQSKKIEDAAKNQKKVQLDAANNFTSWIMLWTFCIFPSNNAKLLSKLINFMETIPRRH